MKILFVINTLGAGGAERAGSTLCNGWAAKGHEVLLVQTFSGGAIDFFALSPLVRQEALVEDNGRQGAVDILQRMYRLRRIAGEFRPDVIVSFLTNVNLFTMVATAFQGFRLVIAERTDPIMMPMPYLLRIGCRLLYRFADMVVVQTLQQGKRLESRYGIMPRLTTIPNPLPEVMPVLERTSAPDRVHRIVSLGRLEPSKRVDLIISAFQRLATDYADWELHIFGDGPSEGALQQQVSSGPASTRIHLHGRTSEPLTELALADIYASASTFEGFPNALMEAMAVGLPTVSADCFCGPREITDNGRSGLLVPVNDVEALTCAMETLMKDRAKRVNLGALAAQRIRALCSRERVLDQWLVALDALL